MALEIDGLTVCVSNSSRVQLGSVRVKSASGEVLASVQLPKSEPLTWLTKNQASQEAQKLVAQLLGNDVPMETVKKLLAPRPSRYERLRLLRTA